MNNLINNIKINNINKEDKRIIVNSNIKQIHKDVFPTCGSPAISFNSIKSFEVDLKRRLQVKKLSLINCNSNNNDKLLQEEMNPLEIKQFKQHQDQGKQIEYLNSKLKIQNDIIAHNIKDVYVIVDKFFLKKSIIKVSLDSINDSITSIDCMAITSKVIQYVYKEQEKYFKKKSIGVHKSPYGALRPINGIKYNGFSTIIVCDNIIICSFDIERL